MKNLSDTINDTIERIVEYRNDYISNEQAVRTQLIEPILNELGWKTANPRFVKPNAPGEDGKIPDYTLIKNNKTTLIVEAKNLSVDLQNKIIIDQLANYCFKSGIDFGILSNGIKWLLFKTFEKNPKDRIIWEIDLEKDKIDFVANSLISFAYDNIDTLDLLLKKSKLLDEAWKSLIENSDSVISIVSEKLLSKVKAKEPQFKIELSDLNSYTKNKIDELFEDNQIEEENNEENSNSEEDSITVAVEDVVFGKHRKRKERDKISVTFPNKKVISHKKVVETFVETISVIGPDKIIPLEIYRAGIPIVSQTKDEFYSQHKIGKYWIMVHTSTKEKLAILNEINSRLNLKLIINTIIDR